MILLDRYIARTLLGATAMVMAVLVVLGALFLFIGEQGTIGSGHYTTIEALVYSLLTVPQFALNALPAGALIGAMLGIGTLARGNELTVMRAAGMAKGRLLLSVLGAGVVLALLTLCVGEFLVPPLTKYASERKAFAKYENVSFAGAGGAWIRDGGTILNVTQQSSDEAFGGTLVFELGADGRLRAMGRAERYRFALWSRIARLLALPVAIAFALPFGFGSMRSAGIGARTTLGLGIGIVYFFLQRMVESGALVFQLDPLLLAALPTLLLALAASVLLLRAR